MIYAVSDLIKRVRLALDMNETDEALTDEGDNETLTLDSVIRGKLEEGARIVERDAPAYLLDSGKPLSGSMTFDKEIGIGRGRMQLPDDFLRLITFKMSDWKRAVTEPIAEGDPRYLLQSSKHVGIRGNPERPVAAIIHEPTGLVLEFWSCTGGESVTLQRGRYLPIPRIRDSGIEICEKLLRAVVLHTAYLTALTFGETERAQNLLAQCQRLME